MNSNYKELHKAVKCSKSGENKMAKALWSLKEADGEGIDFLRSGQRATDPNKIPSTAGSLGTPLEEPLPWQMR